MCVMPDKPESYSARWIRVAVACPYCRAFYEVEALAGVDYSIENPIKCPSCGEEFHLRAGVYYEDGNLTDVYVRAHAWDGKCKGWPVEGPIDMRLIDLTRPKKSDGYSSYEYASDPRVGARGTVRRVGARV